MDCSLDVATVTGSFTMDGLPSFCTGDITSTFRPRLLAKIAVSSKSLGSPTITNNPFWGKALPASSIARRIVAAVTMSDLPATTVGDLLLNINILVITSEVVVEDIFKLVATI